MDTDNFITYMLDMLHVLQVENSKLLEWGETMNWDTTKKFYDVKTTKAHMDMIDDK